MSKHQDSSPEELRRLYEKAVQAFAASDYALAEKTLAGILQKDPRFEDAYEALSIILYNEKKYDAAIQCLKKWTKINPRALMAHTNLSRCYVAQGMILEAEAEQNEARRLSWKEELQTGKKPLSQSDILGEIEKYRKIIELDPEDVLGYFSLGQIYLKAGMNRDASDIFEKAVEVNPKHSASYVGLGESLEKLKDYHKAAKIYRKGIAVASECGDIMPQKRMEALLDRIVSEKKAG